MGLLLQQRAKLELLHDVVVESRLAAAHVLRAALEEIGTVLQFDYALLARNEKDRVHIDALYSRSLQNDWNEIELDEKFDVFPFSDTAYFSADVRLDTRLARNDLLQHLGVRALVIWPLAVQGRTWHCIFASREARETVHADDEMKIIDAFAAIISRLLELREEQRVQAETISTDPLTHLLNRTATLNRAHDAISSAERRTSRVALLYVDIDRFKWINDTFGHSLGDSVLHEIGKRIKLSLRPYDVAGRIGGDEFAIVISDFASEDELAEISLRLIASISRPLSVEHEEVAVSATVGIAIFPNDSSSTDELIRHADSAMYSAKRDGSGTFAFYSSSTEEGVRSRRVISEGLRAKRMDREFILCLQPILDVRGGRVTRAEVLTRWMHPEMGLLAPSKYIDIAKDTRLSGTLDGWVLCKAMEAACELKNRGDAMVLHVNVSEPSDAIVDAALGFDDWKDAAPLIALELHETLVAAAWDECVSFIQRCRAMGFKVGIEGFGTGGLPLARLSGLRIDFIKIDRQLTAQIGSPNAAAPGVEVALMTARQFGWEVIAEGIQSDVQRSRLTFAGADFIQGYLIGHPMTAIDFQSWRSSTNNGS